MANKIFVYYPDHIFVAFGGSDDIVRKFGKSSDYAPVSQFERSMWDRAQSIVGWQSSGSVTKIERNPQCPYCMGKILLFGQPALVTAGGPRYGDESFAGECEDCGWWFCESKHFTNYEGFSTSGYYEGVLRAFDLRETHWNLDHELADLEEQSEAQLLNGWSNVFGGEILSVGKSVDGSIEFFLVQRNSPLLLLRNRGRDQNFHSVELVSHLLGVESEKNVMRTLFITTTSKFKPRTGKQNHHGIQRLGIPVKISDSEAFRHLFIRRPVTDKPWKRIQQVRAPNMKGPDGPVSPKYEW